MRQILLTTLLLAFVHHAYSSNEDLLMQLDQTIAQKAQYVKSKEDRINYLRNKLDSENNRNATLQILDDLYNEYYVFKFDSAMTYADRGERLAKEISDDYYTSLFTIHCSEILAIGGLYVESINHLNSLDERQLDHSLLFKYYYTYFIVYTYWSDYCHDQIYAPFYREKANNYLRTAMEHADQNSPSYEFYQGEMAVYVEPDMQQARQHYIKLLESVEKDSRLTAMASFALAGNYRMEGDDDKYVEYIIKAALCDLKNCTMENMALQDLALYLFEKGIGQIERAENYINLSMENAKFYNNRLRIIEISKELPQIMSSHRKIIERQNSHLSYAIFFISLLGIGLLLTAYYVYRQNRQLSANRRELADSNQQLRKVNLQLETSNQQQLGLNEQLNELNQKLVKTNKQREGLASIYIDLCAKYIDKLGKYQTLVKRKIKANQAQELLQTISSTRISEEDAATFLNRFDKAFLELYPTFVEEFNALLHKEWHIKQKSPYSLTTELRTFALIRLGVKNTTDIAGLLFLSNQTIYNCRSVIKGRAIDKDAFDENVQNLCSVIPS